MANWYDPNARDAASLAATFRYFGEVETPKMDSRVYTDFSLGVAEDPELLALAAEVMPSQPPPNVLYAAVKNLLLDEVERGEEARALKRFYPAVSGGPIPAEPAYPAFRAFCLAHRDELLPGLRTGRTQTCVVHRSAIMLPAIASLPRVVDAEGRVGLLEIGPSVGLNLRLDRYRYVYEGRNAQIEWGKEGATPELICEARGKSLPPVPERLEVVARHGLELAPIDLSEPSALRWLRALIWPEHVERGRLMDEALAVAIDVPVEIAAGDATRDIEAAIARLPADAPRVLFATHAIYQIPQEGIREMLAGIARASVTSPVDLIVMESNKKGESKIDWFAFEEGERRGRTVLAHSDSHGRWIDWGRTE